MSFDIATISAILVSLGVLVFMVVTIRRADDRNERRMRRIVHQSVLMQRNEAAWELCRRVRDEYPEACPGLDFTFKEDGQGVSLDSWKLPYPRPEVDRVNAKNP